MLSAENRNPENLITGILVWSWHLRLAGIWCGTGHQQKAKASQGWYGLIQDRGLPPTATEECRLCHQNTMGNLEKDPLGFLLRLGHIKITLYQTEVYSCYIIILKPFFTTVYMFINFRQQTWSNLNHSCCRPLRPPSKLGSS